MKCAVKYMCSANPIYVHIKKHFCPHCLTRLKVGYKSVVVNSKSPNARNYDFTLGDTFLTGDVEFRTRCFVCTKCNESFSIEEIKNREKCKE